MVWDFCMSFGRLLCLSPFSLSDLENAICHKETNLVLLVEMHIALFQLLIKDEGEYFEFLQNKNRKSKVISSYYSKFKCERSCCIVCSLHVHMNHIVCRYL